MATRNIPDIPSSTLQALLYIDSTERSDFYRAKWENKDVFIKTLRSDSTDKNDRENFLYEIRIMALFTRCSHSVHLYGKTQLDSKTVAIVMEYMEQNLRTYLEDKTKTIEWPEKVRLAKQVAQGVAYIHGRNVCHGDLKSRNILLNQTGQVKIGDYGYSFLQANPAGQLIQAQLENRILCSPLYLQPERLEKDFQCYNEKCDVYDLGLVMAEIATEHLPNSDAKDQKDVQKKLREKVQDPLPLDCPEDYARWIERARAFDPKERSSASTIAQGLGKTLRQLEKLFSTT